MHSQEKKQNLKNNTKTFLGVCKFVKQFVRYSSLVHSDFHALKWRKKHSDRDSKFFFSLNQTLSGYRGLCLTLKELNTHKVTHGKSREQLWRWEPLWAPSFHLCCASAHGWLLLLSVTFVFFTDCFTPALCHLYRLLHVELQVLGFSCSFNALRIAPCYLAHYSSLPITWMSLWTSWTLNGWGFPGQLLLSYEEANALHPIKSIRKSAPWAVELVAQRNTRLY